MKSGGEEEDKQITRLIITLREWTHLMRGPHPDFPLRARQPAGFRVIAKREEEAVSVSHECPDRLEIRKAVDTARPPDKTKREREREGRDGR